MVDVKGEWTFITGASRGIGFRAAMIMAEHGSNLILHSRESSHTDKVAEEAKKFGVKVYTVEAELSSEKGIKRLIDEVDKLGVNVDIIFNNAGLQRAYRKEYWDTPVEDFTESFMINTIAPAMICYHFIPGMIERGFGRVINVSSGIKNEPEQAGYSASKAALDKFTVDLASKLDGTDVMLNLVDPGWCRTDMGGINAPNSPDSVIPGISVGAFADDKRSGRLIDVQKFSGMSIEKAVELFESL